MSTDWEFYSGNRLFLELVYRLLSQNPDKGYEWSFNQLRMNNYKNFKNYTMRWSKKLKELRITGRKQIKRYTVEDLNKIDIATCYEIGEYIFKNEEQHVKV
jgi:hypothetical protein